MGSVAFQHKLSWIMALHTFLPSDSLWVNMLCLHGQWTKAFKGDPESIDNMYLHQYQHSVLLACWLYMGAEFEELATF